MHDNSLLLFKRHALPYFKAGQDVLELGPDPDNVTVKLLANLGLKHHHADILNRPGALMVAMFNERLQSPADRFDIVFSLSVAEHVPDLGLWVREQARVLKPGGKLISVSPVSWPYHQAPVDAWRIYPEGYKFLFLNCGLRTLFTWTGNVAPLEKKWQAEHGPHEVRDTIAIAEKP